MAKNAVIMGGSVLNDPTHVPKRPNLNLRPDSIMKATHSCQFSIFAAKGQRFLLLVVVFLLLGCSAGRLTAQRVSETISFNETSEDWPHEFCVRFKNYNAFTSVNSGGLSGGGIVPKDFVSWGNDLADLDTWFVNSPGESFNLSVTFHFDPALVNPNFTQRALGIFLRHPKYGESGISIAIETSRSYGISTYNLATQNISHPDYGGHGWYSSEFWSGLKKGWYRVFFQFENVISSFSDEYKLYSHLDFIGEMGSVSPERVATIDVTNFNPYISRAPFFIPSFTASKWGGCSIIDEIEFSGPDVIYADVSTGLGEEFSDTLLTKCGERIYLPYERSAFGKSSGSESSPKRSKSGPKRDMRVFLRGKRKKSVFFFARNDSRYTDSVRVRHTRAGRGLDIRTYRVRLPSRSVQNVSARITTGKFSSGPVTRGGRVVLRVDFRARPGFRKSNISLRSNSSLARSAPKLNRIAVSGRSR